MPSAVSDNLLLLLLAVVGVRVRAVTKGRIRVRAIAPRDRWIAIGVGVRWISRIAEPVVVSAVAVATALRGCVRVL